MIIIINYIANKQSSDSYFHKIAIVLDEYDSNVPVTSLPAINL